MRACATPAARSTTPPTRAPVGSCSPRRSRPRCAVRTAAPGRPGRPAAETEKRSLCDPTRPSLQRRKVSRCQGSELRGNRRHALLRRSSAATRACARWSSRSPRRSRGALRDRHRRADRRCAPSSQGNSGRENGASAIARHCGPIGSAPSVTSIRSGATIDRDGAGNRTRDDRRDSAAGSRRPRDVRRRRGPRRDITPLLSTQAFAPLRDPSVFEKVTVDQEIGTIAWPGGVNLDRDVIYAALDLGPAKAQVKILAPSIAA